MKTSSEWVIVRIDGKIASISTDYNSLADITSIIAGRKKMKAMAFREISAVKASMEEVWELRKTVSWDDLILFGTDFQKKIWRKLWELIREEKKDISGRQQFPLVCYSDFAEFCHNRAGVRAVAHAIGLNPVSVIIPCHMVIPKESYDRIKQINKKAETTLFKGDDLCLASILNDRSIDFGEYAHGRSLKRKLIMMESQYLSKDPV